MDKNAHIANISKIEQDKRFKFGVVMFVLGVVAFILLVIFDVERVWRLSLFLLFVNAGYGYFQAQDETWVALAQRGLRQISDKVEKIEDTAEISQVKQQAFVVTLKSVAFAAILTLAAYFVF